MHHHSLCPRLRHSDPRSGETSALRLARLAANLGNGIIQQTPRVKPMIRQNVSSGSAFEPRYGFSRAVRMGERILVAGTAPIWPDDFVDAEPKVQAARCLEIMLGALDEAGGRPDDVVRTRMYITDAAHADAIGEAHGEVFGEIRPASTMVVIAGLLDPRWVVEMELEAVLR